MRKAHHIVGGTTAGNVALAVLCNRRGSFYNPFTNIPFMTLRREIPGGHYHI